MRKGKKGEGLCKHTYLTRPSKGPEKRGSSGSFGNVPTTRTEREDRLRQDFRL